MMSNEKNRIKSRNNIAVTQAWTSGTSQRSPEQFQSFKVMVKYLKLYCQYSSLSSFKYLADSQRTWFERMLWIVIHCVTIFSLIFMVYISYKEFYTSPILTSMDTDSYRTTVLDFPGIAICSVNRISKKSATELANNIFNANITDQPVKEILDLIMQLGNIYSSEFTMDEDRNVEVDRLLTAYFKGQYDITNTMKDLSPHCAQILIKCKLHGTERNCTTLFEFRKTQDGFCCTFNYIRESDDIPVLPEVLEPTTNKHSVDDLGIERGLTVVMEPLLDDYFYPILPVKGWKVIVFNPYDYPDVTSGGVTEVLALPQAETYIDVTAASFYSTKIIKGFPVNKRNCIFSEEEGKMYSGVSYTYSDCIVDCKINDVQKLCGCRPFFYPRRGKKDYSWRICTNTDLECMAKYKTKWWTVFPHENEKEMIPNKNWALHCKNCYPACQDTSYDVLSSKSYITPGEFKTDLMWNTNVTNQGILHVYFSKYGSIRLRQDVASYWYELLSDIGGICGVFIGFSLISIVEMLYFLALVLHDLFFEESIMQEDDRKREDDGDRHDEKIQSIHDQTATTIYWGELLPRSWRSARYGRFADSNRARY